MKIAPNRLLAITLALWCCCFHASGDDLPKLDPSFELKAEAAEEATLEVWNAYGRWVKDDKRMSFVMNPRVFVFNPAEYREVYAAFHKGESEGADTEAAFIARKDGRLVIIMHRTSPPGTLFHELIHAGSNIHFREQLGREVNEAVTELLTKKLKPNLNRGVVEYNANGSTQVAERWIEKLGENGLDYLQAAYFGSGTLPIRSFKTFFDDKLGVGAFEKFQKEVRGRFGTNTIPGTYDGSTRGGAKNLTIVVGGGPTKVTWSLSRDGKKVSSGVMTPTGKTRFGWNELGGDYKVAKQDEPGWARTYTGKDKGGNWVLGELTLFSQGKPKGPTTKYARIQLKKRK